MGPPTPARSFSYQDQILEPYHTAVTPSLSYILSIGYYTGFCVLVVLAAEARSPNPIFLAPPPPPKGKPYAIIRSINISYSRAYTALFECSLYAYVEQAHPFFLPRSTLCRCPSPVVCPVSRLYLSLAIRCLATRQEQQQQQQQERRRFLVGPRRSCSRAKKPRRGRRPEPCSPPGGA